MYRDIQYIRHYQQASGAYPASPTFSQYPFCWLRDGSFTAYAMDRVGISASSRAFHFWAAKAIENQSGHIGKLLEKARQGQCVSDEAFLPTRFTYAGEWKDDGWPNFQLDGYGQWLWALGEHLRITGEPDLPELLAPAVDLTLEYLAQFWDEPCYDAWEENPTRLHTATLASSYAGLKAMLLYRPRYAQFAEKIRQVIMDECVHNGHFIKFVGNSEVDASLLWLSTPFRVVPEDHPLMQSTVIQLEQTLLCDGGLKRYAADSYYGGGAWILLTAWLGWYYARLGNLERAKELSAWIGLQRNAWNLLPEQVPVSNTNPRFLDYWNKRWGTSASPLLWSHAMTVVLHRELELQSGILST